MYYFLNDWIPVPLALVEIEINLLTSVKTKITVFKILKHIIPTICDALI